MNVKMDIDSTRLQANLRKLQKSIPAKVKRTLMQTAQFGTTIILDRTGKGIGYSGKFKPYDAKYKAYKSKGWPSSKEGARIYRPSFSGDSSGIVNLNVNGDMLKSIQSKYVSNGVAQIYFSMGPEAKKAAFNNKKRPFFGFNKTEKARLSKFFFKRLK